MASDTWEQLWANTRLERSARAIESAICVTTGAPRGIFAAGPRRIGMLAAIVSIALCLNIFSADLTPMPKGVRALCVTCELGHQRILADGTTR